LLPAGFDHAGDLPLAGQRSEANTADAELADVAAGPPAPLTAMVFAYLKFRFLLLFIHQTKLCHACLLITAF
jgi:hypothetical protein